MNKSTPYWLSLCINQTRVLYIYLSLKQSMIDPMLLVSLYNIDSFQFDAAADHQFVCLGSARFVWCYIFHSHEFRLNFFKNQCIFSWLKWSKDCLFCFVESSKFTERSPILETLWIVQVRKNSQDIWENFCLEKLIKGKVHFNPNQAGGGLIPPPLSVFLCFDPLQIKISSWNFLTLCILSWNFNFLCWLLHCLAAA